MGGMVSRVGSMNYNESSQVNQSDSVLVFLLMNETGQGRGNVKENIAAKVVVSIVKREEVKENMNVAVESQGK